MDTRTMHIHQTEVVTTLSRSLQARSTIKTFGGMKPSDHTKRYCMESPMDDLLFYILFNSFSVISGLQSYQDNGWVIWKGCVKPCLPLKRSLPKAGLEHETDRSEGQSLT